MRLHFSFLIALLLFSLGVNAQNLKNINTSDLIIECSKNGGELPSKQIAIWYPSQIWQIIGEQMKFTPNVVDHLTNGTKDYLIFAVVDYTVGSTLPLFKFKSKSEISETMILTDSSNKKHFPLKNEDMSYLTRKIVTDLEPMLAKMLGQFGEGMQIIVFKMPETYGKDGLDISKKNNFSLHWNSTTLKWKLPFASVLPIKHCPIDQEEMKGNWDFCPEHGKSLN
ncbi:MULTISPECIES: hypothetical protein [unclassified Flavobacterium]|uniref:hypothetical protein n=1 Tax=unclassified Flavobacterium TaxID=196869 RepID=UPI0036210B9C